MVKMWSSGHFPPQKINQILSFFAYEEYECEAHIPQLTIANMTGKLCLLLLAYISLGIYNRNCFISFQGTCSQEWGEPDASLLRQDRGPAAPVQWWEYRGLLHQGGHQWAPQRQGMTSTNIIVVLNFMSSFLSVDLLSRGRGLVLECHLLPQSPRPQWHPVWRQLPRVLLSLASDPDIWGWNLCDGGQRLGRGKPGVPALLLQWRPHGGHSGVVMEAKWIPFINNSFKEVTGELGTIQVGKSAQ